LVFPIDESLLLTMKGGMEAPARVRAALAALNGELGEQCDDVRLLVSEVVTNAVVHAGVDHESFLKFGLSAASDRIRAVLEYPGEPFTPTPQPEEQHFGLYLVDRLSDSWGVERDDDKNRVWFEISR
jgi:anti-sigma regulatory factor (Ser/Thr protein kinase)